MSKTKSIAAPPNEGYIMITTDTGSVRAARYEYKGRVYIQKEATVRQTLDAASLLTEAGVMSAADRGDMFNLSIASIIRGLTKGDLLDDLLRILVRCEDGSIPPPGELTDATISAFTPFAERVINDFFSLNPALGESITKYVGGLLAMRMAGSTHLQNLIASAISQKANQAK